METTFIANSRMQPAREKDHLNYKVYFYRWNPTNEAAKEVVDLINPALNQEIVDCELQLFLQKLCYASDQNVYNNACTGLFEAIYQIMCYHTI